MLYVLSEAKPGELLSGAFVSDTEATLKEHEDM